MRCKKLCHCFRVTIVNFRQIKCNVVPVPEYKIEREDLLKDLWVFRYSVEQITSRLGFTKQHGVKLKTWMIRCPEEVLYKY